ncbi:hypothetical protein [Haloarchaeobius iranensis]|uniref:Uncharacterized protein n=1 Tax=Haloarchaeobius iranensis TaxID=996166 RepID=A0A1G9YHE0_9EURY|nr:hypothetical protein [Haloarchaeobius iranensis]SDN08608.1 hypothetical protein SAMN05192554_11483 [Haloarchaeobius iranensis]
MAATVSRWARRYVGVAVGSLLAWQVGLLVGVPRGTEVALGLYGFVLHVVFGKAYSLVPSYFDRELVEPRAAAVQLPLTAVGVVCLALAPLAGTPDVLEPVGAALWAAGVVGFVGALAWTVRDNLTGAETGTGGPNVHRERVDRAANAVVPVALAYLLVGSYATLGLAGVVPPVFDGYPPRTTHLLGTGTATLLVFGLGVRLLPRFLVADPPNALVWVVLPAGAVGPALLAATLPAGPWFHLAAVVETVAVVGYAGVVGTLFVRSDNRRTALYGVLLGAVGGVAAVALGAWFAFVGLDGALIPAHRRLTVVGVSLQFYPPNVGRWPGCDDRTALASMALLAVGVAVQAAGLGLDAPAAEASGVVLALVGGLGYAYLLAGAFATR